MRFDLICVDDEITMTSLFQTVLDLINLETGLELRAKTYNNTLDVIRDLQENGVDAKIWLLDIMMPNGQKNGLDLAKIIRSCRKDTFIYAFTALNSSLIMEKYATNGLLDGAYNKSGSPLDVILRDLISRHLHPSLNHEIDENQMEVVREIDLDQADDWSRLGGAIQRDATPDFTMPVMTTTKAGEPSDKGNALPLTKPDITQKIDNIFGELSEDIKRSPATPVASPLSRSKSTSSPNPATPEVPRSQPAPSQSKPTAQPSHPAPSRRAEHPAPKTFDLQSLKTNPRGEQSNKETQINAPRHPASEKKSSSPARIKSIEQPVSLIDQTPVEHKAEITEAQKSKNVVLPFWFLLVLSVYMLGSGVVGVLLLFLSLKP